MSERAPAGRTIEPARRDILPVSRDEPVSGLHPPVVTGSATVSTAVLGHARGRGDPSSAARLARHEARRGMRPLGCEGRGRGGRGAGCLPANRVPLLPSFRSGPLLASAGSPLSPYRRPRARSSLWPGGGGTRPQLATPGRRAVPRRLHRTVRAVHDRARSEPTPVSRPRPTAWPRPTDRRTRSGSSVGYRDRTEKSAEAIRPDSYPFIRTTTDVPTRWLLLNF